jgi:hypothetical protein
LRVDALVCGEQRHPGLLQLVFDLRTDVCDAGDPFNGLADDGDDRRSDRRASSSASAMPPSRGMGMSNCSWAVP